MPIDWTALDQLLNTESRFLLTSHVRPDCDALGSELGLAGILESLGKQVHIVNADATPENIAFIDPQHQIKVLGVDYRPGSLPDHDVFVVLDTSAWGQLGNMADELKATAATKVVIDHHVSSDDLGAVELKDTKSEATGRLITDLALHLGVSLTPEISMPLFAALVTDTGWLRFSSVTSESYEAAGRLIDGGADPTWIYGQLYEQTTLERYKLRSRILDRLTLVRDGRLAYTWVMNADFKETGAQRTDTEDAVNQGLRIKGTRASFIMVEQPDGRFKVSFRSRDGVDVSKVAEQFGGGGHKAAAGAFAAGPFDSAETALLDAMQQAVS